MKSGLLIALLLVASSCVGTKTPRKRGPKRIVNPQKTVGFTVVHYNVKEMDSKKIRDLDPQLTHFRSILSARPFHILSLNEIQYDLPSVPTSDLKTEGQNLESIANILGLDGFYSIFNPANTGKNALKKPNNDYYSNTRTTQARQHADQVNFGIYPAQYSTGALSALKVIDTKVISKLKWKDFNPEIDLTKYTDATGKPLPQDIELFDKNFTDATLDIDGRKVHLILLHTVPAYHFGNKKTPNYVRNRDQLRFLEWYLTGETDITVDLKVHDVVSLKGKETFIAMGDWNTSVFNKDNPGSVVLESLFTKSTPWMELTEEHYTSESNDFRQKPKRLLLDYIIYSKDIEPIAGEILKPNYDRVELGCSERPPRSTGKPDMILVSYFENNKKCFAEVSRSTYEFAKASDHLPLIGTFKFK